MKTNTLSLIMGAALILPSLAMAAPATTKEVTPAAKLAAPVANSLEEKIEGPDGELLATQPGAVESDVATTVSIDEDEDEDTEEATVADAPLQPAPATQALNMQHSDTNYQPLIDGEAFVNGQANNNTAITLQEKKKDQRGELLATQPADVEFKENRRITVSR